jgi:hypothetical protein
VMTTCRRQSHTRLIQRRRTVRPIRQRHEVLNRAVARRVVAGQIAVGDDLTQWVSDP